MQRDEGFMKQEIFHNDICKNNISQMKITILYLCVVQVLSIFMRYILFSSRSAEACFIFYSPLWYK